MDRGLVALVGELHGTAAAAALADPDALSDHEVRALAIAVQRLRNLVDAVDVAVVGVFDARRLGDLDGLRTAQWLAHHTQCPKADAAARVRMARTLRHLPGTRRLFRTGVIGRAQVEVIVRQHAGRTLAACAEHEGFLADQASQLSYADFTVVVMAWRKAADPDGPPPDARDRGFDLARGWDGEWQGRLVSPAEQGALLEEALARFEQAEFEADWAEARALHGAAAAAHHLRRTASQRRHDALLAMARRACGHPEGTREPKPLVTVVVTKEAFERELALAAGLAVPPTDPTAADPGACRLADGTPLAGEAMLRLALAGFVRRVVFDARTATVSEVSRPQRLYTGPLRHALLSIVPCCTFPGCDVPARRCEVDHRRRWRHGGRTTPENGAALCDRHQHLKERGFTDQRQPDGTWTWHRPDGTRLE